jgi:hypothetical protein
MKWRVWEEKLLLVLAILEQEEGVLANEIFVDQMALGLPGLWKEVEQICKNVGLPNICKVNSSKKDIKEFMYFHHMKELK